MNSRPVAEILEERRTRAIALRNEAVEKLYEKRPDFREIRLAIRNLQRDIVMLSFENKDVSLLKEELDALRLRENAVMAEEAIDESFFAPRYFCTDCEDTGFVNGKSCHCRERLKLEKNYDISSIERQLERQNFSTFDLSRFRKSRQEGEVISPYENMKELYTLLKEEYVAYFSEKSPNLFLYGPTGVGKTFLLSCVTKGVLDRGFHVYYQTAPELLDFLVQYSFMYAEGRQANKDRYLLSKEADLLVIDDLGTEFTNAKMTAELFLLINTRLLAGKPTIISSNLEPEELSDAYDDRIASRIQGQYRLFELFGPDQRRQ